MIDAPRGGAGEAGEIPQPDQGEDALHPRSVRRRSVPERLKEAAHLPACVSNLLEHRIDRSLPLSVRGSGLEHDAERRPFRRRRACARRVGPGFHFVVRNFRKIPDLGHLLRVFRELTLPPLRDRERRFGRGIEVDRAVRHGAAELDRIGGERRGTANGSQLGEERRSPCKILREPGGAWVVRSQPEGGWGKHPSERCARCVAFGHFKTRPLLSTSSLQELAAGSDRRELRAPARSFFPGPDRFPRLARVAHDQKLRVLIDP